MSTARYHQQHGHDSDDEDEDLELAELDPLQEEDSDEDDRARPTFQGAGGYQTGGLGGAIRLHRAAASRHEVHHTVGQDVRPSSATYSTGSMDMNTDDDAPLLQHTTRDEPQRGPSPAQRQGNGVAGILARMRSTPQSRVAEEYGVGNARDIHVGSKPASRYPPNIISNAKYTPWSFLPKTLYHEFSFFLNMYFLLVALSQIVPALRIGYLLTYIAPLAFVVSITIGKEAIDDITRRRRDAEANAEGYTVIRFDAPGARQRSRSFRGRTKSNGHANGNGNGHASSSRLEDIAEEEQGLEGADRASRLSNVEEVFKRSGDLKVGDVVKLGRDQRVPADVVILQTLPSEKSEDASDSMGEAFIRTDQLDGETDWKLRLAPPSSQALAPESLHQLVIKASKPERKVNDFVGSLVLQDGTEFSLNIDNTAWANTVLASSCIVLAVVVYTGPQTRQAMSTSSSRSKTGLLEYELNSLTKILCFLTLLLSVLLVAVEEWESEDGPAWYVSVTRYLILFSTIVPISLRVNLDLGKSVYAWYIQHDQDIPGTVVRTSTIPEDLGRIEYLLSDKTGTLTQNDMQLKKIHVGTVSYANEAMTEVITYVRQGFSGLSQDADGAGPLSGSTVTTRSRREIGSRVRDLVLALALCHNVTPTVEEVDGKSVTTYQASSPDEIAIVRWCESVGLRLAHRDRRNIVLESAHTGQTVARVEILHMFPFTSEGKRMGIIVRFISGKQEETESDDSQNPVWFFQKGADTVMSSIVAANDWLDEETSNMAREGLRTLVVGRKRLLVHQLDTFTTRYREASVSLHDRDAGMARVVEEFLERDLELLGVTGVEDKLQRGVKPSLELLRNAGIKIWMLTGDKVETARCVAISSKLVARGQYIYTVSKLKHPDQAHASLEFLRGKLDACLLIDGESLAVMLAHHEKVFISIAVRLSAVVACRCSPTQKADVAQLIRTYTKKRICCIGDGGNDVSMIQAADVGIGIVGKEGRQASLAADFSVDQFCYITKLLVWHGRNSYKRSAKLAQFVIHRGLIIAVCQTVFSTGVQFRPDALFKDWLLVGYATVYTMMPVFSLTLDTDIPVELSHLYPELYAELSTSRSLSYRTFFIWVAISIYQGTAIQLLAQIFVPLKYDSGSGELIGFARMISVSYTALILNELVMVAAEITTWHWVMIFCIVATAVIYFGSVPFLGSYFDLEFIVSWGFWWRVAAIAGVSLVPVYAVKIMRRKLKPPSYRKVQQGL